MVDRINVLHLSDLHLSSATKTASKPILNALKIDIKSKCATSFAPNVFVFSGDIVKGGDEESSYIQTYDKVLSPLLEDTLCDSSHLFIVPGNHDAQRSVVEENILFLEGLLKEVKDQERLNQLANEQSFADHCAKVFSNYNKFESALRSELTIKSNFLYSTAFIPALGLSIVSINSALTTFAGFNKTKDEGRLLYPDSALIEAIESVPENSKKILVSHHPLECFAPWNQSNLRPLVRKHFDLHLYGHMHEEDPVSCVTPDGNIINHQSGAAYATDSHFKGYSILSMVDSEQHVQVAVRQYFEKRLEFDAAISVAKDGLFHNTPESKLFWESHSSSVDLPIVRQWLSDKAGKVIREQLDFRLYEKPITEVFVEPPLHRNSVRLSDGEQGYDAASKDAVTIQEIVDGDDNLAICGYQEHGKSTLLKYLALSILEKSEEGEVSIPAVLNFNAVTVGKRQIQRSIRAALNCELPGDVKLEQLLDMGVFTILVDDYDILDKAKYKLFSSFMDQYPRNRFIFSLGQEIYENMGNVLLPDFPVPFDAVFIAPLTRSKLGELVRKWTGQDRADCEKILDRIVDNVVHINVPSTPVVGTIFLTIFDKHEDFTPINQAVLVQQFIETLLDKHAPLEARRETYDYRNKEHYLSYVAGHMAIKESYRLSYEELLGVTKKYFDDFGFIRNAEKDIAMFEQSRIFKFEEENSYVSFRYRSFCEYFIARYMEDTPSFLNLLLQGDEFLSFPNEIDYYSGIKRNHLFLVKAANDELEKVFTEIDVNIDIDGYQGFRMPHSSNSERLVDEIIGSLSSPIPDEVRERMLEERLPTNTGYSQRIFRPKQMTPGAKWIAGMDLYARLIKNGEVIPVEEKREHLFKCFEYWSVFMAQSLFIVPDLAAKKEHTINGIVYRAIGWEGVDEDELVEKLCEAVAINLGSQLKRALGSEKLRKILAAPLRESEPLIIKFFRKMLYVDLRLPKYVEVLEEIMRECKDSEYLSIIILRKMQYIHQIDLLPPKEGEAVRNLITLQAQKFTDMKKKEKDSKYRSGLFTKLKNAETMRKQKKSLQEHKIIKPVLT